ncbi:polyhydroxyalkanoic acid system family protein [Hansschlegelia beijingensis]|uniref:polyhydroxyalkanoic acid system family protein n=1 Tax=Hansschlegelia beijingensis TaxID=1133344 RepID=UPI003807C72C
MSKPVTMTVSHQLGQEQAIKRIKDGIVKAKNMSLPLTIEEDSWADNVLQFRVSAMGQSCLGQIEVLPEMVKLEVTLPGILGFFADKCMSVVRKRAQLLLQAPGRG